MMRRFSGQAGITLVEATIMLSVVAILAAATAPAAQRVIARAQLERAVTDMKAIRDAISSYLSDNAFAYFTINGTSGGTLVDQLVSDGDIPREASISDDNGSLAGVQMRWQNPVDNTGGATDFLERHLVTNNPRGSTSNAYSTATWRGAYLTGPVDPDPWGNRYMVNVRWLGTDTAKDVFVYSVGPDERIDTLFEVNGAVPGADDIIILIRRDAGLSVP